MQLSANHTIRYVTGVFAALCFAPSVRAEDASDAMAVLSIVNKRCVECHDPEAQSYVARDMRGPYNYDMI